MSAVTHVPHFRRYQRPEPSNWRLLPIILLVAFNVGLYGYLIVSVWRMVRP